MSDNNKHDYIEVLDMTRLFNKEILIYSFFDMHFKTPVRIVTWLYFFVLSAIWTLPVLYIFWPPSPYIVAIAVVIPAVLANLMGKPIWGGKSFLSWFICQIKYVMNPKMYYDCLAGDRDLGTYEIDNSYTVSRTRDYYKLYLLKKQEKLNKRKRGKM